MELLTELNDGGDTDVERFVTDIPSFSTEIDSALASLKASFRFRLSICSLFLFSTLILKMAV
jgi:hypothetical protein